LADSSTSKAAFIAEFSTTLSDGGSGRLRNPLEIRKT
jgi:hypothetical protein